VRRAPATAKLNLALVVGPRLPGGRHEVTTVLQGLDLSDRIALRACRGLRVGGFSGDSLVEGALRLLAREAGVDPGWSVRIRKRIPVASGLGGGSSDAATALRLANETLARPLSTSSLLELARRLGADGPFFLTVGPQLGEGDGALLTPLPLPQDYWVVLALAHGARKPSTAAVYDAFDARGGEAGYPERRAALTRALARVRRPRDLTALPPNDLACSPLASELRALGAFRGDVTGAGPAVYGLFHHHGSALAAKRRLARWAQTWLTAPAWYR
jgi:4-diphosphocytidyl-2-C-methyl-D-erythritol kinase